MLINKGITTDVLINKGITTDVLINKGITKFYYVGIWGSSTPGS